MPSDINKIPKFAHARIKFAISQRFVNVSVPGVGFLSDSSPSLPSGFVPDPSFLQRLFQSEKVEPTTKPWLLPLMVGRFEVVSRQEQII
ncbi:Uncharacterized protein TCM_004681 [Theobroma cacao]|uniref:Uncharacterized protein n=1 Tax=Theobroma cacao TaxID=3641 RepID=A0A061DQX7_THECC|nr:Uncharacterized protein TCM_004681 [Theobroma cacao]